MKFKPLSVGTLPRVFVNLLALDDDGIVGFAEAVNDCAEMKTWFETANMKWLYVDTRHEYDTGPGHSRLDLAEFFLAVLNLSKVTRGMFVKDFDRLLNKLYLADFFGTEGQRDPRGDATGLSIRTGRFD